jgi:UDP-3-O-[3-hydroxymyristoyl] glucosamine N-acyltransferase
MVARAGFTLGQLAAAVGATLEGDAALVVTGVASLESAGPHDISFVADARYRQAAETSRAAAFLVPVDFPPLAAPVLRCPAPRRTLIDLLGLFHPPAPVVPGVHPSAVVDPAAEVDPSAAVGALAVVEAGARIGPRARIHPLVYVGAKVEVGEDSVLHPHVVIGERVRIGRRVVIHGGTIVGTDGFGYAWDGAAHRKIPQVGAVVIEDDVEIGANTTIDRATLGQTVVRRGTKIDNLVMLAHNVEIGEDCIVAAQAGVAGSSRLGRRVILLGQAGIADHVAIGDGAVVGGQAGISQDVEPGARVIGTWARPDSEARRIWIAEGRLPELLRRVRALERRLEAIEGRREGGEERRGRG